MPASLRRLTSTTCHALCCKHDFTLSICPSPVCHAELFQTMLQIVTVGYGDVTPYTAAEQGVTICVEIVGILFFGILLGSIGDMLQRATKSARKAALLRDKMGNVENWLRNRMFPKALRNSIRAYYAEVWAPMLENIQNAQTNASWLVVMTAQLLSDCGW